MLELLNNFRKDNNSIRKLRLCDNFEREGDATLKSVNAAPYTDEFLMIAHSDYGEMAYFLPWKEDAGLYLDLPKVNPEACLFLTSELSGCFVGVQKLDDAYRIRHYNFQTQNVDGNDFCRYNFAQHLVHWLAPDRGNVGQALAMSNVPHELYTGYSAWVPVVFWGEYINNDWVFYYQATDNTVHRFLVI